MSAAGITGKTLQKANTPTITNANDASTSIPSDIDGMYSEYVNVSDDLRSRAGMTSMYRSSHMPILTKMVVTNIQPKLRRTLFISQRGTGIMYEVMMNIGASTGQAPP